MNNLVIDYDHLYVSMMKCRRGVSWKPSVKHFLLNSVEETLKMERDLESGKWTNGTPRPIKIYYPKRRDALSIPFRDRVYQRSINDNVLYPKMSKKFIYDNCACQIGKGTDFARKQVKQHLWRYYTHHKNNGYVLQIDIHGYYSNMRHDSVRRTFSSIDNDTFTRCMSILNDQYSGDIGFNPGSQMVQIAGISVLNPLDHFIKEKLRVKHYIRYMDDFWLLTNSKIDAESWLKAIQNKLSSLGLEINKNKTKIIQLKQGFSFLGFNYKLLDSGKVLMTVNSQCVKHEKLKILRMSNKVRRGDMTEDKMRESYNSTINYIMLGNSTKLVNKLDHYYKEVLYAKH